MYYEIYTKIPKDPEKNKSWKLVSVLCRLSIYYLGCFSLCKKKVYLKKKKRFIREEDILILQDELN
jgi:hypothetical protein